MSVNDEIPFQFVIEEPLNGIDYGIQQGKGSDYETLSTQRSSGADLVLCFSMPVKKKNGSPNFTGPIAQGPPAERFVYVDIGRYAGQTGTEHGGRMKVRLSEITWRLVQQAMEPGNCLQARLIGDQTATVDPIDGWSVVAG